MINDKLRLVDGFRGLPGGVDGSQDPVLTPETSVYYAENVVFRGGAGPKTRPGFEFLDTSTFTGDGVGHFNGGTTVQCVANFSPPGRESVLVLVVDGKVIVVDVVNKKTYYVNDTQAGTPLLDFANKTNPCYACQVEEYLVIQDGTPYNSATFPWNNGPKILSFPATSAAPYVELSSAYCQNNPITRLPSGAQMAYGQGRLFVSNAAGREIVAGDIAFGGSLVAVKITSSKLITDSFTGYGTGRTKITTATVNDFIVGDFISISGHSASPTINGTFRVEERFSTTEFSINASIEADGAGGYATEFNSGKSSDALNFSETTFINEGGNLLIPLYMGSIQFLAFMPIQDVSTGQGDLIVVGEFGAVSFSVATPRTQWKETIGFQRVLFSDIGALSSDFESINGDIYFRSRQGNGIRTYRSARAEFGGFGMSPISAELDQVFLNEDLSKLSTVSMIHFDDRLLMTCKPNTVEGKLVFKGIVALDFRPCSVNNGKAGAIYDGIWGGLQIVKLVKTVLGKKDRAFAVCFHGDDVNSFQIWELTKDAVQDKNHRTGNSSRLIRSLVLTKAYGFESPFSERKLIHGELWFSGVGGWNQLGKKFTADLKFRPDANPNWTNWGDWELCFSESDSRALRGYAPQLRAVVPEVSTNGFTERQIGRGYDFKLRVEWRGRAQLEKLIVHALQLVEPVGAGVQSATSCVLVRPDSVEETLENSYKAWDADGQTVDFSIQLTTDGTDYLLTGGTSDYLIGNQKYI